MPKIDYVSGPFYCATSKMVKQSTTKDNRKQRCIGPNMSHMYVFNYTMALTQMYAGLNQWHYLHVNAAHESTGLHAETLDLDLKGFLDDFMVKNAESDVVVFLAADHGMRYGDWFKSGEAFQENRLPAFFLISSRTVVDSLEGSLDTLHHNSFRLTSKLDIRKTLTFLSGFPSGLALDSDELFPAFNLYTQKIPNSRSCQEAGIPLWHCSCLELLELEPEIYDKMHKDYVPSHPVTWELEWLLYTLAEATITHINEQVFTPKNVYSHSICRRLSLGSILKAYALNLDVNMEEFKLEVSVKESEGVRFEVTILMSTAKDYFEPSDEGFPVQAIVYNGYRKLFRVRARQILNLSRRDKYAGTCELVASKLSLDQELCVCYPPEHMEPFTIGRGPA